jgi:hypothetical protein
MFEKHSYERDVRDAMTKFPGITRDQATDYVRYGRHPSDRRYPHIFERPDCTELKMGLDMGKEGEKPMGSSSLLKPHIPRRVVHAYACDADRALDLKDAVLIDTEHLTEDTNESMWHELDLKEKLKEHNEKRKFKELKPIRMGDLERKVETLFEF